MEYCNHKWVTYQPLFGECYVCCANERCGISKATFEENKAAEEQLLTPSSDVKHFRSYPMTYADEELVWGFTSDIPNQPLITPYVGDVDDED